MQLLPANTQEAAEALNDRALDFVQSQRNKGSRWSDLYTDGTRFAIVYEPSIAGAFTEEERTAVIASDDTWTVVPPPLDAEAP